MASTVVIRKAKGSDAAAVTQVIRAAYEPFRTAGLDLPPVEDGVPDALAKNEAWVAEIDGRVVGAVFAVRGDEQVHVMNLAVAPEAGGHGLGRALIEAVEAWAKDQGAAELGLTTHVEMTGTQAFYRRLDWQETGRDGNRLYMAKRIEKKGGVT